MAASRGTRQSVHGAAPVIPNHAIVLQRAALAAVFTPDALIGDQVEIEGSKQEWICKASRDTVFMRSKDGVMKFEWHE